MVDTNRIHLLLQRAVEYSMTDLHILFSMRKKIAKYVQMYLLQTFCKTFSGS